MLRCHILDNRYNDNTDQQILGILQHDLNQLKNKKPPFKVVRKGVSETL